jgi:ABC-2 type transport system ATP-binding protein
VIEISDFTKRYGDLVAVDRLNLTIRQGETFGFIGPNGAGKSTTIRFLATLLRPTHGDAKVNGYSVRRSPLDVRRSIGYMPDSFGVYEGMSVEGFLRFFAVGYGLPRARHRRAVDGVLERLGLAAKRKASLRGLSRGMKQRLCLAKTLLHDPPVLILDEPANALDPRARVELKSLLAELRQAGKTVLVSSHVLSELADCCTTVGIIERGKLLLYGPMEEVFRRIGRKRVLEIRLLDSVETALRILNSDPKVGAVQVDGLSVTVEVEADDGVLAGLLSRLVTEGAQVLSFAEKELSLEEVFMRVTKGVVG